MHIAQANSATGFRIGGLPPIGVVPQFTNEGTKTQYFGTFPFSAEKTEEMSIFCSFNYDDPAEPRFISKQIYKVLGPEIIECVFHSPARRTEASCFESELEGYSVKIGEEAMEDLGSQNGGSAHKIGGIPFLKHEHPMARKVSADLLETGYLHMLSWSFPGLGDCTVKGEWPFANYSFHLYLKATKQDFETKALLV